MRIKIKGTIKSILKSEFFLHLATMMTGTVAGQIITLVAMPFLTRLYNPSDFGTFALLFSTISVFGYVACLGYDHAMMLPKDEPTALKLLKLGLLIASSFSVIIGLIVLILPLKLFHVLGIEKIRNYIFIIPFGILLIGLTQLFTIWHNRNKNYKIIASNKIIQNISSTAVNLSAGFIKPSVWGLIGGFISGQVIGLVSIIKRSKISFNEIRKTSGLANGAKSYINFPLFLAPMMLLNTISLNIPIYIFSVYYTQSIVGLYSQAYKAINYPLIFITAAFSTVFFQKLNVSDNKLKIYKYSFFYSLILGFIILSPVMVFGTPLFVFVFGKSWAMAGKMAAILCPFSIISFSVSNVCEVFSVTQKNHILLVWQIIYFIIASSVLIFFRYMQIEFMLAYYSIICSVLYLALAYIGFKILKREEN